MIEHGELQMTSVSITDRDNPDVTSLRRFQKIKADIHRQIVEMLDISKLEKVKPDRLRKDVRTLAERFTRSSSESLTDFEQGRMIDDVMHEVFGLGPLEA